MRTVLIVTTTQHPQPSSLLAAVLGEPTGPQVPLDSAQAAQVLRVLPDTIQALGDDPAAWTGYYQSLYACLGVPSTWLRVWVSRVDADEVHALRRLHRLLVRMVVTPAAEGLTVAQAVSALAVVLMRDGKAALHQP